MASLSLSHTISHSLSLSRLQLGYLPRLAVRNFKPKHSYSHDPADTGSITLSMITIAGTQCQNFKVGESFGSPDPQNPKAGSEALTNHSSWMRKKAGEDAKTAFADIASLEKVDEPYTYPVMQPSSSSSGIEDESLSSSCTTAQPTTDCYCLVVTTVGALKGGRDMVTVRYTEPGEDNMVMQISVSGGSHVARRVFRRK